MRNFKRLLSVILAMALVFTTMAVSADFSDVSSDKAYYQSVSLLNAFGIINGYDDGTFGPENDVTRAEFSAMLMRALASGGLGSSDPAGMPFTDLGGATWAISDIRTAYDLKIVNGTSATTFAPLDKVTYEQALKMIVCALNYNFEAEQIQKASPEQPWYYGYMQVAVSLKLTNGISVSYGVPAKRWEIAQMIYNALDVEMLEKIEMSGGVMYQKNGKTLLGDKLGYTKAKGEVYADGTNTISPDGKAARDGYALIYDFGDSKTYTIAKGTVSLSGLLGKEGEYYYKTDDVGEKTLVAFIASGSGDHVTMDADDISGVTGTAASGFTISYYPSATATKLYTAKTVANPVVSVNGVVISSPKASDIMIEAGTVELISNGGDYSKINIESYETYVVKSVNTTDKYIVDINRTSADGNTLYIDESDGNYVINMKNSSGSSVSLSNLAQYNVLSVRKGTGASGRQSLDITVSNTSVSGAVKSIDTLDRKINIAGTSYSISNYLVKYGSSIINNVAVGDTYKCYLDKNGKIAYMMKTTSSSTYLGYIAAAEADKSGNVKIALISSKVTSIGSPYLVTASKVKIDGESCSSKDEILSALARGASAKDTSGNVISNIDGNGNAYSQLVKYTVNSSGEINAIETAYLAAGEDASDENLFQGYYVAKSSGNKMTYKSTSYDFIGASNNDKFRINSSTQVFIVPTDRSDYDSYGKKTWSYFKDGKSYVVEPYNVTGSLHIAGAVVVYEAPGSMDAIDHLTPMFIITGIKQTLNSDSNEADLVTGYQISTSGAVTEKSYYTDAVGVISGKFSVGDVIMFTTNNKGYISNGDGSARTLVKKFSPSSAFVSGTWGEGNTYSSTTKYNQVYSGLLLGCDSSTGTQMFDLALVDTVAECETANGTSFSAGSSVVYFTYDTEATNDADKVVKQDGMFDLSSVPAYNDTASSDSPSAAKIFVYRYSDAVRMVYIIK